MDEIKDVGTTFEARKKTITHKPTTSRSDPGSDGIVLMTLELNPADDLVSLFTDPINTRYTVVMVRTNDQGEPVPDKRTDEGQQALRLAMALCRDENFQFWMAAQNYASEPTEEATIDGLKICCGIGSRKELMTSIFARRKLLSLRDAFTASFRR